MALKGDYVLYSPEDISFYCNVAAERGLILVHSSSGSGAALDQADAYVAIPTGQAPSTLNIAGLLNCDMVSVDYSKTHENFYKDEVGIGGKVPLVRHGWVVTNKTDGSPTAGAKAYLTSAGLASTTDAGSAPVIGRFLSGPDADGYSKLEVNIL